MSVLDQRHTGNTSTDGRTDGQTDRKTERQKDIHVGRWTVTRGTAPPTCVRWTWNSSNSKSVKLPNWRVANATAYNDATLRVFMVCNAMHMMHRGIVANIEKRVSVVSVNKAWRYDSTQRKITTEPEPAVNAGLGNWFPRSDNSILLLFIAVVVIRGREYNFSTEKSAFR